MKIKVFLLAVGALAIATSANAQKGIDNGTQYGSGEDSVRCLTNISLFIPYAKSKNYKDAYPFWKKVYDECPGSTKAVYSYGADIMKWKISQETDATKKAALINDLMKLYDDRVKYFGNDRRYGKDWIVARKAQNYNLLKGDATDPSLIYKWTGEVIDEFKENTEPLAVSLYMFSSLKMMQADESKKAQYVQDFLKCSSILENKLEAAKSANSEDTTSIESYKTTIEQMFAASGAADCETLQNIYAKKIEDNKDNLEFLKETLRLFARVGCKEMDAYFAAAEYAYKLEPTAESAMGLGAKAFKDGDLSTADKLFNEAIGMSEDSDTKADLYYALGALANQQHNYSKAKQYCLKCLAEKDTYGRAYLIIGLSYASMSKSIYPDDPVLAKCVFYAAVDKFEKARQVDPSIANDAAKLIGTYRQYFPSKEEIFMHPSLNMGDSFTISGIGETVRIR